MRIVASVAALTVLSIASFSGAATVTTFNGSQGWVANYDNAGAGAASISTDQPRSGNASAKLTLTSGADKAVFGYFAPIVGSLGTLSTFAVDYFRDSSSTDAAHFAPSVKIYVRNSSGQTASLLWERVYNAGGATPTNAWQSENIVGQNFWIRSGNHNFDTGSNFQSLASFAGGYQATDGAFTAIKLDQNTQITGLEIGAGSGWSGTFTGYVDNVALGFSGGSQISANFETPVAPLPAAAWAGIAILGKLGFSRRRA